MYITKKPLGFTLIELLITVAIVGILATIAYPSYTQQMSKSRRADAKAVLMQAAQWMERFATENNRYTTGTGVNDQFANNFTKSPIDGANTYYTIALTAVTDTTFTITATPANVSQSQDGCAALTLSSTGAKGVADAAIGGNAYIPTKTADECWR